jgi:hypothetical protein
VETREGDNEEGADGEEAEGKRQRGNIGEEKIERDTIGGKT